MTKCKQCGKTIEQTGNRERLFCDDACRKADKRKVQSGQIQSGQITEMKADKSKADTPKVQSGQAPYYSEGNKKQKTFKQVEWSGKTEPNDPRLYLCKGCQKPVLKNVDICSECVGKKITRKSLNLPDVERIQLSDKTQSKWNWQKHKIAEKKKIAYILYYLKENIAFNTIIRIGGKLFELNKPKQSAVNIPPQFK